MEEPPGLRWALLSIGADERFARESKFAGNSSNRELGCLAGQRCDRPMTHTSEQAKSFLKETYHDRFT